jgi:glycosyltransferase involved in cell wall biosynthesis
MSSRIKKNYYKWLFGNVSAVASVSMNCLQDFKKVFNWDTDKIAYLPIGINFPFPPAYNSLEEAGVYVRAKQIFINCAALMPEKNHSGLLRIFKKIHSSLPDSVLLIYGKGPLRDQLQKEIDISGLAEVILIKEPRPDIVRLLPLASALLMPSLIEGLPGIILEAFACDVPVFANSVGGIPEVIVHGETGWLSESGNEDQMADLVISSLYNFEKLQSVKELARHMVESRYANKNIAKSFEGFYTAFIN